MSLGMTVNNTFLNKQESLSVKASRHKRVLTGDKTAHNVCLLTNIRM